MIVSLLAGDKINNRKLWGTGSSGATFFLMNPYAKFIGDRAPVDVIAATPLRLAELVQGLGDAGVNRSFAPGKWSARQILCHLADCEVVFAFRLRQTLAETHHVIQPFDQDAWAASYGAFDTRAALAVFTAVRHWNEKLIASVPREDFAKPNTHPERGAGSFGEIVETMAGHDLNHLGQLESIAAAKPA
jgi:hypothetical protein